MAKSPKDMLESMKAGLLAKTGKPLDHWVSIVKTSGIEKHGEQIKLLKSEHGLGHGHANFVCQAAKGALDADTNELLEAQYSKKPELRPIYDSLAEFAVSLGSDVQVDPKKTSVALRRAKNFAVVTPATKTRIDLGINLKGEPGTERLLEEKPGSMCTHKIRVESVDQVDDELKALLTEAYNRAG
ncbi:MAG: DUF4287 domain-containing protein [Pseudomonadota bacterium]